MTHEEYKEEVADLDKEIAEANKRIHEEHEHIARLWDRRIEWLRLFVSKE